MPYSKPVTSDMYSTRRRQISNVNKDKRVYSRTADKTHKLNVKARPMRGGIRL